MIRVLQQRYEPPPKAFFQQASTLLGQEVTPAFTVGQQVINLEALPKEIPSSDVNIAALMLLLKRHTKLEIELDPKLAQQAHMLLQRVFPLKAAEIPLGLYDLETCRELKQLPFTVGLEEELPAKKRQEFNTLAEEALLLPQTLNTLAMLSRYSGYGGIGGNLNEYYTRPSLANTIWGLIHQVHSPQRVLEPSCGIGIFLQSATGTVDAVELDPTSATIAQRLFPHVKVYNTAIENFLQNHPDTYDCIVGNPPFGLRGHRADEEKEYARYFLKQALQRCKGGGIIAMILPASILTSVNDQALREAVLNQAHPIAIYGLPTSTFHHSHTEAATTDLWFLQKRAQKPTAAELSDPPSISFLEGTYHQTYPDRLLGQVEQKGPLTIRSGDYPSALAKLQQESLELAQATPQDQEPLYEQTYSDSTPKPLFGQTHSDTLPPLNQVWTDAHTIAKEIELHHQVRKLDPELHQKSRQHILNRLQGFIDTHGDPHQLVQLKGHPALPTLKAAVQDGQPHPQYRQELLGDDLYDPHDLHSVIQFIRRKGLRSDIETIGQYFKEPNATRG